MECRLGCDFCLRSDQINNNKVSPSADLLKSDRAQVPCGGILGITETLSTVANASLVLSLLTGSPLIHPSYFG
jgi:hypothetical protein